MADTDLPDEDIIVLAANAMADASEEGPTIDIANAVSSVISGSTNANVMAALALVLGQIMAEHTKEQYPLVISAFAVLVNRARDGYIDERKGRGHG